MLILASRVACVVKNPSASARRRKRHNRQVRSLGQEDPMEEGMATHSSVVLAWRIPGTEEPGGLPSTGLQRVRHDRSDSACTHAFSSSFYR